MCKNKLEPTESLCQRQGVLIKEIITLSLEFRVILQLEDKYNVSSDSIRLQSRKHAILILEFIKSMFYMLFWLFKKPYRFISFAREGDLLAMLHPLLNVNFKNLLLLNNLLTLAPWAAILLIDALSSPLALIASTLHLLYHGRPQLADGDFHT